MAKNMIRKSLALGATTALVVTGFAALPANAAGLADKSFVSLAPTDGAEYDVLTGNSEEFSLTANEASSVAGTGRNVKFLVTDADEAINPTAASTVRTIAVDNGTDGDTWKRVSNVVTVTAGNNLADGDLINIATGDLPDAGTSADPVPAGVYEVTSATSTAFTFAEAGTNTTSATTATGDTKAIEVLREARETDGSYVVDSGVDTDATDEVLILTTGGAEDKTRSVTVTAWVDNNGNDEIDATEYTSETRTVTFHEADEVTGTATIQTLTVGATSVVAHVATTPTLNGDQMSAGDVDAEFTVQGSSTKFAATSSTWNTTKNVWVATLERSFTVNTVTNTSDVTTITTTAAHGFSVGETVVLSDLDAKDNGTFVIATVPTTTTFTHANDDADASDNDGTVKAAVVAGSYSAKAQIGAVDISAAVGSSVEAVKADDGKTSVTETPNINTTLDGSDDNTAVVRKDTKSVDAVFTFEDDKDAAVSAGRPVVLTVNTITNATGVKVNGTSVDQGDTVSATTDANGQVALNVTTTSAANNDVVKVIARAEGVAGTDTFVQYTWKDASYTLYDVNGAGVQRSIAEGGAYSFDFLIADQWAQPQTGDLRLQVALTGNTVSTSTTPITNGRTTVTVSDADLGSSNVSAVITPQKLQTNGTTYNGTGTAGAVTYTLYPASQTGASLTLTTADDSVPTPTTAVVAGDSRLTMSNVTGDGTAGTDAIELTGVVTDGTNGTVKSGAPVTISGPSSLLFVDGNRAQFGSITVYANASGAYSVHVRSNIAQKETVVTATSQGGSKTDKITFEPALAGSGVAIDLAVSEYVSAGSTVSVTATLTDKFGNPVTVATAGDVKFTYTGPGFTYPATLPDVTDANGQAKLNVILGSNDTGSGTIVFQYDQESDNSFTTVDGKDLSASATFTIGEAPADTKVNAGSFKGYVAVYARGYEGQRLSAKIGNDWVIVDPIVNNQENGTLFRVTDFTGAGVDIAVRIYIDRVLEATIPLTTK